MKQMMFYAMTEAETFDPSISVRGLADIRAAGFDSIYLEFRNTRAPHRSSRFRAAVARICAEARRLGLAVVVDASLRRYGGDMLDADPDLFTETLAHGRAHVKGGTFELVVESGDPSCQVLENAWTWPALEPVGARCRLLSQVSEGGGCAMTRERGQAVTRQAWTVEGLEDGELFVVLRRRFAYADSDLGHPGFGKYLDRACDDATALGADGVVWDEPHFGFHFLRDTYPIGTLLYDAFAARFGYDLRSRLPDLWLDRDGGQVRHDFAELLESRLARLETDFKSRMRARTPRCFVGIHRTMHEELSDDFRIGSVDYFRHNRGVTAGFTDSVFEREDSMVAMLMLARALGQLSDSGDAWNNSWGFRPTATHLAYYLRLMGCLGVRWLGHAYHGSMMFGPGYPHHPTWAGIGRHLDVHRELLDRLAGAVPDPDTAVLYNWRGLADFSDNYLHQHRRDLLMGVLELSVAQAGVTVIDPGTLAAGRAETERWVTPLGRFRRILALWPNRLDLAAWEGLERAAAGGVEIMLVGPPARVSDTGADVSARWAALAGCAVPAREAALAIPYGAALDIAGCRLPLDPARMVPNWQSNPERTYPDHIKAWELSGGEPIVCWEGRPIGIRHGGVTTVTTELPQVPGGLAALWPVQPVAPAGFLAFAYTRGEERLLALCARHAVPLDADFEWEGHRVTGRQCRHGLLLRGADGTVSVWGEGWMRH